MNRRLHLLGILGLMALPLTATAQLTLKTQELANTDNEPAPVHPVPTARQLAWNETEFYGFFHYGMNTYTGYEWGYGNESETKFAPTKVPNPTQWLTAAKSAGMKGAIAVVKHHDGFCLWPTSTTDHCVSKSNNYGKQTNIPETFSAAAQALELKYGFYISPWDRNSSKYGTQDYIDDVFIPQCVELANYGADQFEMWFDGANGGDGYYGGKNTTVSVTRDLYYDVPNLRYKVHSLAPNCVMWGYGGEARWIGNENGEGSETSWSTHPMYENDSEAKLGTGVEDYWLWNAAESDAKATSGGWFWHSGETVTSAETLFKMYLETVGRNATFLLNFPPDQSGELPSASVSRLAELGNLLTSRLGTDLALGKTATATATRAQGTSRTYDASNITDGNTDTYWATDDNTTTASVTIDLGSVKTVHYVALQEYIKKGQRVQGFSVQYSQNNSSWSSVSNVTQTTIGYKRIIPLGGSTSSYSRNAVSARYIKVTINQSKACPLLHTVSVY